MVILFNYFIDTQQQQTTMEDLLWRCGVTILKVTWNSIPEIEDQVSVQDVDFVETCGEKYNVPTTQPPQQP